MGTHYDKMIMICREAYAISKSSSVLSWDQETHMPPKGAEARGRQMAVLSGLTHDRFTCREMGEAIRGAEGEALNADESVNLREIRRDYERAVRVPVDLVREMSQTSSRAKEAWREARKTNDFPVFAPLLEKMIDLKKRYAEAVGYEGEPYNALIEDYEPGMTVARLSEIFGALRPRLIAVVEKVRNGTPPRSDFLRRRYPEAEQIELSRRVLGMMQFDFQAGRMDVSTHPFTTSFSPHDVRLTTRFSEDFFNTALFGTMHEGGHALYEQGLPAEHDGTPLGDSVSLGIHESQSRLWENQVGRGRAFWRHLFPAVREMFPDALHDVTEEEFYRGVNEAKPSMIRVEADELFYNMHIMLRFEIERGLIRGDIRPSDAPQAWRERMKEYVGIVPGTDTEGVLQDIHWSMGLFGYFATYSLGNLYAAQFMDTISREIPGLDDMIAAGDLKPLREWLREKIHLKGKRMWAEDLVQEVTGEPLNADYLIRYLEAKFGEIYGF